MTTSKVMMQFGSAQLSAEGTDDFINSMFEKWSKMFEGPGALLAKPVAQLHSTETISIGANAGQNVAGYENVFDELEGKLKIIAQMPGNNKADKARSTALVVLFGNLIRGQMTTSADEIREHCLDQGCYDSSNFASHLKGLKDKITMNTKPGGGYDVKLTAPGRKAAQAFVEKLNNEA